VRFTRHVDLAVRHTVRNQGTVLFVCIVQGALQITALKFYSDADASVKMCHIYASDESELSEVHLEVLLYCCSCCGLHLIFALAFELLKSSTVEILAGVV